MTKKQLIEKLNKAIRGGNEMLEEANRLRDLSWELYEENRFSESTYCLTISKILDYYYMKMFD